MPRLKLDPTSPIGISVATDTPIPYRQSNGYVSTIQFLNELQDVEIASTPSDDQSLAYDSASGKWIPQTISGGGGGAGDVVGPASSLDNTIPRFDGLTGKVIQGSGVVISDTNVIQLAGNLDTNGYIVTNSGGVATVKGTSGGLDASIEGGPSNGTSAGGKALIYGANGGATSGNGGNVQLYAGDGQAGNGSGGDVILQSGSKHGTGTAGRVRLRNGSAGFDAIHDMSALTGNRTFAYPNTDGTLVLADGTQTLTNKSISGATNTLSAIPNTALATNPLARANHTGTQAATTISDFSTAADARISNAAGTSIASLSSGKVPTSQLPAVSLTTVQTAASQVAQLALTAEAGDVVVRTDENKSYMHNGGTAGTMADYTLLNTPTDAVTSVNGQTGVVSLAKSDVGLGNVDNTSDANKPVSTAQATADALNLKIASNLSDLNNAATARTNLGVAIGSQVQAYSADTTLLGNTTTGTGAIVRGTSPAITTPTGIVKGDVGLGNVDNTSDATKNSAVASLANKDLTSTTNTFPIGMSLQFVDTSIGTLATGTTLIPADDTIPQITEGTEFMTLAITPKATTNRLKIEVTILLTSTVANFISVALFQGATANALNATTMYQNTAGGSVTIHLTHMMAAGTTSATTFRVRAGGNSAGTTILNGNGTANRLFGTLPKTTMTITEYKA